MTKIWILYEKSEGIWRLLKRKVDGNIVKIGRKKEMTVHNIYDDEPDSTKEKAITFESKSFWGKLLGLNIWGMGKLYRGSYAHHALIPWKEISKVPMDSEMYNLMSKDDTLKELFSKKKSQGEIFMILILAAVAGFFAGTVLGPTLLAGLA